MTKTTSSVWNNTIKNISRLILGITLLMVCSLSVKAQQTTWTGTIDSDWETSGNWDSGIPGTNDDAIIPNNSAVDPIVSATTNAVAKSLILGNMNLLTINTGGSLTIDGASSDGILINGSIQCNGTINVDNTGGHGISISTNIGQLTNSGTINIGQNGGTQNITLNGISNAWTFLNASGGVININDTDGSAIANTATGTTNNFGTLKLGQSGPLSNIQGFGIFNEFAFTNDSTGLIQIDNINDDGALQNQAGTFTNKGIIEIGQTGGAGNISYDGIRSHAFFENISGATITIDNTLEYGLDLYDTGYFTNAGTINVGKNGGLNNIGYACIASECPFINSAGGLINLDNTGESGYELTKDTLDNTGVINIGQNGPVEGKGMDVRATGTLLNNASAFIKIDNTGQSGFSCSASTISNNFGIINVGQNGAVNSIANSGVFIEGPFVNRASGQININNTTEHGIITHNTTFDNFGTINTDKPNSSVYSALVLSGNSGGTFTNKTGANLNLKGFSTGYNGYSNTSLVNEGTIIFDNLSSFAIDCLGSFTNTGTVKGNGILEFNNTHSWSGILSPGLSPGLFHSQSDFEFSAGAILEIEVEGTNPSQYDRIGGDNDITLGGTLAVTINYAPTFGDRLVFLTADNVSGTFDAVNPALPTNWTIDYSVPGEVALVFALCPTIGAVTTSTADVCANDPFDVTAIGLVAMDANTNGDQDFGIDFLIYNNTPADPYNAGGTSLGIVPFANLSNGNTEAILSGVSFPNPGTFEIYAILSPTPTDPTCRPVALTSITINSLPPNPDIVNPGFYCSTDGVVTHTGIEPDGGGTFTGTGVSDNGDGSTFDYDTGLVGPGVHTVTYTMTNANGCQHVIIISMTISAGPAVSFTPPNLMVCIEDPIQNNLSGGAPTGTGGVYSGIGVIDDGNGLTYRFDPTEAAPFGGNITITYTFTSANGCTATASGTVFVDPVCCELAVSCPVSGPINLECAGDIPVITDPATAFAGLGGVIEDSCNPVDIIFSDAPDGGAGCIGDPLLITRTFTVTDLVTGETVNCPVIYSFVDTTAPIIFCPSNTTIECDESSSAPANGVLTGSNTIDVFWPDDAVGFIGTKDILISNAPSQAVITDINVTVRGDHSFISDLNLALISPSGTTTTFLQNSNNCTTTGNSDNINATFDDQGDPFNCVHVSNIPIGDCSHDYLNGAAISGTIQPQLNSFAIYNGETPNGTWMLSISDDDIDIGGCINEFILEVSWEIAGSGSTGVATAEDNCTPSDEIVMTSSDVTTQTTTGCGQYQYIINRTWTATDPCGNSSTCVQTINVDDTTPPQITCPIDLTIECDESTDTANTGTATATDNCAAVDEIEITWNDIDTQTTSGCGQYQYIINRTWTATDTCGNSSTCVQTINVVDTTLPQITCPIDLTIECDESTDPLNTGTATATDNCAAVDEIEITWDDIDTQTATGCGQYLYIINRTWTATDPCGNSSTCVQTINVVDTTAPTISCPSGATLTCFESVPAPINTTAGFIAAGGTISDNCSNTFTVFSTNDDNGGDNCPGNAKVLVRTYYVQDACGNTSTCEQTFTYLESTQGPVITDILPNCYKYCSSLTNPMASDITYEADCSFGAMVSITGPLVIGPDNCPGAIYRYTYTVTDDCGRVSAPATRDFIIGNQGPTIECPTFNLILNCGDTNNSDYIETHLDLVTANTSCGLGATISHFPQDFSNISCGNATVVTFTATDDCGRTATCTTTITVQDNTSPTFTAIPPNICDVINCSADVNYWFNHWIDYMESGLAAVDDCDTNVTIQATNTQVNTDCPNGTATTIVDFVASDNCGNTAFVTGTFIVEANPSNLNLSGIVATETGETVEHVAVTLEGNNTEEIFETLTDGQYLFDELTLGQNYYVSPYLDEDPLNGVSSFDLVLIAKHLLQIESLNSPYKMIAADINNSGSITTMDLLELRKLILYINESFPENTSWRFLEAAYVFPQPGNPFSNTFPEAVYINGLTPNEQHDFVGVKIGDVNGNAIPNDLAGAEDRSFVEDLVFNVSDQQLKAGEIYEVTFRSDNFEAIHGYQYSLEFDQGALSFIGLRPGGLISLNENNFGLALLEKGVITTSWTSQKAQNMASESALFHLTFRAQKNALLREVLQISSQYTKAEAYTGHLELMDVQLRFKDAELEVKKLRLYQNQPNPFSNETVIAFELPEASAVTLKLFDVSGRMVKEVEGHFPKGHNSISISNENLVSGLYHYQLMTPSNTAIKKMVYQAE